MKNIDFQKVIEWLSFALKCPVCGYKYNLETTKIVDTQQDEPNSATLLVHSDCGQCKSSVVFSIIINGLEIFTMSMITDLTGKDIKKFSQRSPVSADDALNMHLFLREFDGNWVEALKA